MNSRWPEPLYDEGIDRDGFAVQVRRSYVGREEIIGEFKPVSIGDAAGLIAERGRVFRDAVARFGGLCESPIEEQMGVALLDVFRTAGYELQIWTPDRIESCPSDAVVLVPQFKWGGFFRSDFALWDQETRRAILIECDGKDFHSSPDQVDHDRKKDAAASALGFRTIRFTGADIHADARRCAQCVLEMAIYRP